MGSRTGRRYIPICMILSLIIKCGESILKDVHDENPHESERDISTTTNKFQVYRMVPHDREQLDLLNKLYRNSAEFQLDFWKAPTNVDVFADVMVPPDFSVATKELLTEHNIEFQVIIDDVQRLIMQREKQPGSSEADRMRNLSSNPLLASFFSKRMKDSVTPYSSRNRAKYGFGDYHSYNEIMKWMNEIELYYPHMAKTFTIGTTHEGRPIRGIKIGNPITDVSKRAVWIDGGMHARHTALYFVEQLIAMYGVDPEITKFVDTLSFYVVPVANPDGFEYSRSDVTPQTRFWRKNRGMQVCRKDRWRRDRCCGGVDLNRNFDFHWGEIGSSDDLCSDIFQGTSAFSEPESRAIRDKILSPELNGKVDAFITLHTYSQMWIHPYNHERKSFPDDIQELQTIGKQGVQAIEEVFGTKFRFGTGADILYPSAGGSDDWAKAHAHIKYVYLLELRPGEEEWDGFLLDRRQLIPTGKETWEGVKVVINAVMRKIKPSAQPVRQTVSSVNWQPQAQPTTPVWRPSPAPVAVTTPRTPPPTPAPTTPIQMNRRTENAENVSALRTSLHDRLARLRQSQLLAKQQYERNLQKAEQQRQVIFWQNQQNRLHSGCADRSPWCANWIAASPRICTTSTVYMRQDCRSSCGFCSTIVAES
ncbi:zinc carboxypeptidase domain-containing protein [Ditylenchus destructor]|nr:zinc carboxypeptidase domain-containing protein [Ditylenchus destructor]